MIVWRTPEHTHSAVVPVRYGQDGQLELCMITSNRGEWIFPKGWLEPDMSPQDSALKEAWEEAGIHGAIVGEPIGTVARETYSQTTYIAYYLMHIHRVLDDWPERLGRRRRLVSTTDALTLAAPYLTDILDTAIQLAPERLPQG